MSREKVREKIFERDYQDDSFDIRFGELPMDLQDDDIIDIIRDEGYYSENNSWDAFTTLVIYRERDKTPEELEKDKEFRRKRSVELKNKRYEAYLELKKEFDGGNE